VAHPRRIVPFGTYLITRRCYQRTFRLRPCPETNRIFVYCLAFAAQKTGVLVHAIGVMSNHHHLVVTDPRGLLPIFLRELHRMTAKAINASQGQWENLWSAEPCSVVRLVTDADVVEKIAYVAANPVKAGLVKHPRHWPGVIAWTPRHLRAERPQSYFARDSSCPPELTLVLSDPPTLDKAPQPASWRERVAHELADQIAEAHREMQAEGRDFLGRGAALATSFAERALTDEEKRVVKPTFAAKVWEVHSRLRRAEKWFRTCYRLALEQWRAGEALVTFPNGTWAMRGVRGVVVEETPLAA
jgi:REP element-mobilizing transposase RayT